MTETLVVGAVPRFVEVKERHDEPRPPVVTTHAARRLNVLGVRFRLTEDDHKPKPRNIEAHRDYVRRNGAIDPLGFVEPAL